MKFSATMIKDVGIEPAFSWKQDLDALGISGIRKLHDQSFVFVKNKKFFNQFLTLCREKGALKLFLVLDQKLWKGMDEDQQKELDSLKAHEILLFTTTHLDRSICQLSHLFYEQKITPLNDMVDGRQMGSAQVHPTAWLAQNVFVGENVTIGANVKIYPGAVIMSQCEVGDDCVIYPNVTLFYNCLLGKGCRIHPGSVIGSDGFGYNFYEGVHHKVWHWGGVRLGENVEIGANCTINGGTFDQTTIGEGTKIDSQVHIAHNCKIGKGVILCGQTGIAGSATVGDFTVFAGKVALTSDAEVGPRCQAAGGAMITRNWPEGSVIGGHPARELKEWMKSVATLHRLSKKENK